MYNFNYSFSNFIFSLESAINLSTLSAWSTYVAESAVLWILCTADSAPLWNWLKGQPAWNNHINFYKLSYNLNQSIPSLKYVKLYNFPSFCCFIHLWIIKSFCTYRAYISLKIKFFSNFKLKTYMGMREILSF